MSCHMNTIIKFKILSMLLKTDWFCQDALKLKAWHVVIHPFRYEMNGFSISLRSSNPGILPPF